MKKQCLVMILLVLLLCLITTSAFAGTFSHKNVKLSPSNGSRFDDENILWSTSGTLYVDFDFKLYEQFMNPCYYQAIEVELYRLEEEQGSFGFNGYNTKIVEIWLKTLHSKNYNKKDEIDFSANGNVSLSPGSYRIKVIATTNNDGTIDKKVVKEHDFTVYRKEPSYCTVNILYKYDDGTVFKRDTKKLSAGTHTIENDFYDSSVTLISSSSRQITVDSNGNGSLSTVEFVFKKNKKNNNSSNSSNNNPSNNNSTNVGSSSSVHDIGIPNLNGRTYYEGDMNIAVLWVQQQMKQTGRYYQNDGSRWDVTGNLGDHTMEEIARFMQDNGYRNHDGHVDQTVINTFASYLGNNVSPVLVGGFYDKMDTIMIGGSAGSMKRIDKNSSSTSIKWVQCCLSKLGYYHGSINGRFDSATISAVHAFQEYAGFVKRDYVTLGVARDMILFCNNRGCDLSDLP